MDTHAARRARAASSWPPHEVAACGRAVGDGEGPDGAPGPGRSDWPETDTSRGLEAARTVLPVSGGELPEVDAADAGAVLGDRVTVVVAVGRGWAASAR
jgi:hypothetical protein